MFLGICGVGQVYGAVINEVTGEVIREVTGEVVGEVIGEVIGELVVQLSRQQFGFMFGLSCNVVKLKPQFKTFYQPNHFWRNLISDN